MLFYIEKGSLPSKSFAAGDAMSEMGYSLNQVVINRKNWTQEVTDLAGIVNYSLSLDKQRE